MSEKKLNIELKSYDEIFTNDQGREEAKLPKVKDIALSEIDGFADHPFKVKDDEDMKKLVESIRDYGVLIPAVARRKGDRYELVSGHRRKAACEVLGIEKLPMIVREMTDEEAVITMVDSNVQREHILPSEKAFAYKMKLEAMNKQGKRTDLTFSQVGKRLNSYEEAASQTGDSRNQIFRYIRLTNLVAEILQKVDDKQIAFNPAVELSYLTPTEQKYLLEAMECENCTPSLSQAQRLKKMSQEGQFTKDTAFAILTEEKPNQKEQIHFPVERVRKYFPKNYTPKQMEETIEKLLSDWQRKRTQRDRDER